MRAAVLRFVEWLDRYGETSHDHQSYFASDLGRAAKALYYRKPLLGKLAVAPMIFSEAFVPSARRFFWKPQRFPIADAHYAMGFAYSLTGLGRRKVLRRAVHFLEVLEETRCPGYEHYCWGYPFNWETRHGTMRAGTPLITTVPYVYEAFLQVYQIDRRPEVAGRSCGPSRSTRLQDYHDFATSLMPPAVRIILCQTSRAVCQCERLSGVSSDPGFDRFSEDRIPARRGRNLNFVLESQNPDGSWYYSTDGERDFVDHFHTCFVLKALARSRPHRQSRDVHRPSRSGVDYYVKNLFDEEGMPKPFSRRPRLTVYRHELYDYAECINLAVLLQGRFPALDRHSVRRRSTGRMAKADGSFRAVSCCSVGTILRCIAGRSRSYFEVSVFSFVTEHSIRSHESHGTSAEFTFMCGICGQYNFADRAPVSVRDTSSRWRRVSPTEVPTMRVITSRAPWTGLSTALDHRSCGRPPADVRR